MTIPLTAKLHLPGLNALRFYVAISVVIAHISNGFGELRTRPAHYLLLNSLAMDAQSAVTLFFVLSGFLITFLLLKEVSQAGSISITRFYARCALRIWPLYYLIAALGLGLLRSLLGPFSGLSHLTSTHVILVLLFMPNFVTPLGPLGHLWSIGVEERFYLVWPWVVRHKHALPRVALGIVLVKLMIAPIVASLDQGSVTNLFVGLRWESLAIGAAGAVLYHRRHTSIRILTSPLAQLLVVAGTAYLAIVDIPLSAISILATSSLFLLLVLNLVASERLKPILEAPLLTALGQASYGIYMFHFPLLYVILLGMDNLHVTEGPARDMLLYATTIGGTLSLALASYRFYEAPFLALKERFAIVQAYR